MCVLEVVVLVVLQTCAQETVLKRQTSEVQVFFTHPAPCLEIRRCHSCHVFFLSFEGVHVGYGSLQGRGGAQARVPFEKVCAFSKELSLIRCTCNISLVW